MKKLLFASLVMFAAFAGMGGYALAMGTRPVVDAPATVTAIPKAELDALRATQRRVAVAYSAAPIDVRQTYGADYDKVNTSLAAAIEAQRLGNRAAFNQHRDALNTAAAKICAALGC